MEVPFFFENEKSRLFGVLHQPDTERNHESRLLRTNIGVVFCSPFAEEKLWSHRVFVNLARLLAQNGYSVLRFDQRGHGDSDGGFEDATVESYLSDISKAVETLHQKTDVQKIGLLGLRLGATIAALAARKSGAAFMVLWEPIINGKEYFHQCLRSNLTTQLLLFRKIIKTRERLEDDLKKGESVNIDGYLVSPEFYSQVSKINLLEYPGAANIPVLLIRIFKARAAKPSPEMEQLYQLYASSNTTTAYMEIMEEPFWGELKTYFQRPETLFLETLSWLNAHTKFPQFIDT